ncbi:MAG: aminopeptidase P family N-terminal domain-containing protein, partial [Candidatus Kariarchaeaceae archaeon]
MHPSDKITPKNEIKNRISRLQSFLTSVDLDGFLIFSIVELFYYTGIGLDGALFIPKTGEPIHLVKRNRKLAEKYSGIDLIQDFGRRSKLFETMNISGNSNIALELDILPYSYTKFLSSLNDKINFQDGSSKLRELRSVKSQYEVDQISIAAKLIDESFEYCIKIASPNMSEIALAAKLDKWLFENGHHGYIKTRAFNSALLNPSYVISSTSATLNIHFTPISGGG